MRPQITEGKGGFCGTTEAVVTSATPTWKGGYGIITKKGATSYFDTLVDPEVTGGKALEVGMPIYLPAWEGPTLLKEGDEVQPIDMAVTCWITDNPQTSVSIETVDMTTQCDRLAGRRNKEISKNTPPSSTGTINGFYETESEEQKAIESAFNDTIIQDSKHATYLAAAVRKDNKATVVWFWDKACDPVAVGEPDRIQFRKLLITGYTSGGTGTGGRPFSFNYETLESYIHSLKAA